MAIYHSITKIIGRSYGRSAVAAAAYRSGESLTNEREGITHDYTRKGGVEYSEIMLPENAPEEYRDRGTLWNSVEQFEKSKNAQLAREIELALPTEFDSQEQIEILKEYVKGNFVDKGMCADVCLHDKGDGNPHAHIMLTMRPINEDGTWGAKSRKEYDLDKYGNRIKLKSGEWKSHKVSTTDWDNKDNVSKWRESWADICNRELQKKGVADRIDHRSYAEQGIDKVPTIHMGKEATRMEKRGIQTELGDRNREAQSINMELEAIKDKLVAAFAERQEMEAAAAVRQPEHIGASAAPPASMEPEQVAANLHEKQERYIAIKNEIDRIHQENALINQEINRLYAQKEALEKDWKKVLSPKKAIDEQERQKEILLKNKGLLSFGAKKEIKEIDGKIEELREIGRERVQRYKDRWGINTNQKEYNDKIEEIESNISAYNNKCYDNSDRITDLLNERKNIEMQYKTEKGLADMHPDKGVIDAHLGKLKEKMNARLVNQGERGRKSIFQKVNDINKINELNSSMKAAQVLQKGIKTLDKTVGQER